MPTGTFSHGGALYTYPQARTELLGVTIQGNRAQGTGGAMFVGAHGIMRICNSLIWETDGLFMVYPDADSKVSIRHSLTASILAFMPEVDWVDSLWLPPQFVTTVSGADAPTVAGDLRLLPAV